MVDVAGDWGWFSRGGICQVGTNPTLATMKPSRRWGTRPEPVRLRQTAAILPNHHYAIILADLANELNDVVSIAITYKRGICASP